MLLFPLLLTLSLGSAAFPPSSASGRRGPATLPAQESLPTQNSGSEASTAVGPLGGITLPDPDKVEMLRLRSGEIRFGEIVDHDPDGLRLRLLSNGGIVRLAWSLLDPSQELALRERFGYIDVSSEELMVDVETLLLVDGRELTGVILSRDGDHFVLKFGGSLQMVPKARVQSTIRAGRLPALDVYSREELYAMHQATASPDDPEDQLELARTCEQILDFDHAVEHYERVLELDQETSRPEVEFALERARAKAKQQAQIDYLREIETLRRKKLFDDAIAKAEAFAETFPESPLQRDALELRDRVLLAREALLREFVRRQWLDQTRRIARTAAKKFKTYAEAVAYCDEQYSKDVLAAVHAAVTAKVSEALEEDDVLAYWATRKKVHYENATYGQGTWLLGEARALAGTEDKGGGQAKKPENERDAQRDALEKKIEKFLQSQARTRQRRSAQQAQDDFETFWAEMSVNERAQWIRAYYAEFSGDFELRDHPYLSACPSCGGKGVHELINAGATVSAPRQGGSSRGGGRAAPGGGTQLVLCSTCHGIGVQRRIYYR